MCIYIRFTCIYPPKCCSINDSPCVLQRVTWMIQKSFVEQLFRADSMSIDPVIETMAIGLPTGVAILCRIYPLGGSFLFVALATLLKHS